MPPLAICAVVGLFIVGFAVLITWACVRLASQSHGCPCNEHRVMWQAEQDGSTTWWVWQSYGDHNQAEECLASMDETPGFRHKIDCL